MDSGEEVPQDGSDPSLRTLRAGRPTGHGPKRPKAARWSRSKSFGGFMKPFPRRFLVAASRNHGRAKQVNRCLAADRGNIGCFSNWFPVDFPFCQPKGGLPIADVRASGLLCRVKKAKPAPLIHRMQARHDTGSALRDCRGETQGQQQRAV